MSGPVQLQHTLTEQQPDGRYVHRLRQSWLNSVIGGCPEQARMDARGQLERRETDATAVGTAVHAAIEAAIIAKQNGTPMSADDIDDEFMAEWSAMQAELEIHWVKRQPDAATAFGRACTTLFAEHIYGGLRPLATEVHFSECLVHSDEHRDILLSGTIDYIDERYLGDWKTASRAYQPWEKDRWAIQPSAYWFAARNAMDLRDIVMQMDDDAVLDARWMYLVFPERATEPQLVPIQRQVEWDNWFIDQCLSLVPLLEADLDMWPKNDQSALCSPIWATCWESCKGSSVTSPSWVQRGTEVSINARPAPRQLELAA